MSLCKYPGVWFSKQEKCLCVSELLFVCCLARWKGEIRKTFWKNFSDARRSFCLRTRWGKDNVLLVCYFLSFFVLGFSVFACDVVCWKREIKKWFWKSWCPLYEEFVLTLEVFIYSRNEVRKTFLELILSWKVCYCELVWFVITIFDFISSLGVTFKKVFGCKFTARDEARTIFLKVILSRKDCYHDLWFYL